jgi:hypothetical protein
VKRYVIGLLLLIIGSSIATAQAFTRRSSQEQHDALKKYYEIIDFRLGGRYDLANPSKWENGGEGGKTLESVGGGKLRTAYIAVGTPRRNAAGEITNAVVINSYYSGDSTDMYEQWVKGAALSGGVPIIGPGRPIDTDRYYVVMVDPWAHGARASRPMGSAPSFRNTATSTWCRRITGCCAIISESLMRHSPPASRWAARRPMSGVSCIPNMSARSCSSAAPRSPTPRTPSATGLSN